MGFSELRSPTRPACDRRRHCSRDGGRERQSAERRARAGLTSKWRKSYAWPPSSVSLSPSHHYTSIARDMQAGSRADWSGCTRMNRIPSSYWWAATNRKRHRRERADGTVHLLLRVIRPKYRQGSHLSQLWVIGLEKKRGRPWPGLTTALLAFRVPPISLHCWAAPFLHIWDDYSEEILPLHSPSSSAYDNVGVRREKRASFT